MDSIGYISRLRHNSDIPTAAPTTSASKISGPIAMATKGTSEQMNPSQPATIAAIVVSVFVLLVVLAAVIGIFLWRQRKFAESKVMELGNIRILTNVIIKEKLGSGKSPVAIEIAQHERKLWCCVQGRVQWSSMVLNSHE